MGILEGTSSELTVPLPKYLLQQDSFLEMSLRDVTSPSGVRLLFPETALVFQETLLHSSCSILRFCSRRLCSSSWILICEETIFLKKCTEHSSAEYNWKHILNVNLELSVADLKLHSSKGSGRRKKYSKWSLAYVKSVFKKICSWAHAHQTVEMYMHKNSKPFCTVKCTFMVATANFKKKYT